uniref:cucumisin-like n=1 Tax=Fragaria vesca subsp. vesca TaxID=101020 RepID=UPI0005CA10A6|nr:PREDICTED: cucumisin-like [Fragaria vesca subsp. vesca]
MCNLLSVSLIWYRNEDAMKIEVKEIWLHKINVRRCHLHPPYKAQQGYTSEHQTMAKNGVLVFSYIFPILMLNMSLLVCISAIDENRKVYIVYMGSLPSNESYSPLSHHLNILERVVKNGSAANLLMRSYRRSFNGFAAKLTDNERQALANMKEVVSVFPSTTLQLQTTRSWDFIGLNETTHRNATVESDIIIGVIDTGIWPESESFKDDGFAPAPKKWKGACKGGENFTCNNKIIGARFYGPIQSARDEEGHGTHTASTAAGNDVKAVSFYKLAQGAARGAVPSARIATYAVCSANLGCSTESVLAAFDDAIADGVDVITISLGGMFAMPFQEDVIAIGAFHASVKGILTTNSAGNSGPIAGSVTSVAPWLLSVAASSIDRRIIDKVILGNGTTVVGLSVNSFTLNGTGFPLIYGKAAASRNCSEFAAGGCHSGCLDGDLVKGKIVLCDEISGHDVAYEAGAVGSILNADWVDFPVILAQPATILRDHEYNAIKSYMNSTEDARANILKSEAERDDTAPVIASFSARGPNIILPEIIKPDISAPGVTILAAYSPVAPVTNSPEDKRHVKYSIMSGTSMSCPHAAGAAAYVKAFHPDWSPAAIKSSLMTTAWPMNVTNDSPGEFAYGSGHINPVQAINPGLVYEASKEDYIKLLCSILGESMVRLISGDNSTCPTHSDKDSPKDHNYPSFAGVVPVKKAFSLQFHRVVKNVGFANSTYSAKIFGKNTQVDIKVVPEVLSFESLNQEKPFDVTLVGPGLSDDSQPHVSASLVWSDGTHSVRSPILIHSQKEY